MNITVLTYVEREDAKDYDIVVPQVVEALEENGHKVSVLGVHADVKKFIAGLTRRKPDLVFNIMETFGSGQLGVTAAVGLIDLLNFRFTGGGPGELYLREDKSLSKKLLAYEGVKFPDFAVFSQEEDMETGGNLRPPFIVKPLRMDASIGIDGNSLVRTPRQMWERVLYIHKEVNDTALVEEFIEGREFYVGILGNINPMVFPPMEMDFSKMPEDRPKILDAKAKWDADSDEYKGTEAVFPELPDELRAKLQKVALDAYRALRVRDYGRIDMRLTNTGEIYVIEVNASCYLERESEFARAASRKGFTYPELIQRIVDEALNRYGQPKEEKPVKKRKKAKA